MTRVAIYGAGGFGKEVRVMIDLQPADFKFAGFIDDFKATGSELLDSEFDDVVLAIADPRSRLAIVERWNRKKVLFQPLINADVRLHTTVKVGKGSVICAGAKLTADISVGEFVLINLNATIGHDVIIGDFTSIMPSVNISGNVSIGKGVFLGTGATVLQGVKIGDNVIIGAGSLVRNDVPSDSTMVGVPARKIR